LDHSLWTFIKRFSVYSILKYTWSGTEDLPLKLGKGVAEYLTDLNEWFKSVDEVGPNGTVSKVQAIST